MTVHFVTAELDGGPSIIRARVAIQPSDNAETLAARVLSEEHKIYPLAIQWFCEGRIQSAGSRVLFDGETLDAAGILHWETLSVS